ncbi:hypothetical protein N431DRAFT_402425 [Stipitochalara longipes BDJ]|nr:hypothetical protein N431DRAFT_402425 [Stipitochalara longipes BDJ]
MKGKDESDACLPRADKVEEYCFGATLKALQTEKGEVGGPIAWLDERSSAEGKERARSYRGLLTARSLYQELMKPRFHINRSTSTSSRSQGVETASMDERSSLKSESEPETQPDAERRKIFITDLDRWAILALIGTTSEHQALGLRDAIYKHLAFESFIGVIFPPTGLAMFQLAFHLPFYAWRISSKPHQDHRLDANANSLRQSRDVSFLNWKGSDSSERDFLYEAQISCLVAGTDEWRWVAYGFVDTYFDAADEAKETVKGYHEDATKDGGLHTDPLTFGVMDAEKAISTPREYFLSVFRIRIAQVTREWEQVVSKVRQSIRIYEQTHRYSLCQEGTQSSSMSHKEHDEIVRKSRDWIILAKGLTTKLLLHLSKTVDACEEFCLNHALYFQDLSEPPNGDRSLPAIQITFFELGVLRKTLESLTESCTEFARDLELHLMLESSVQLGNLQHKIAEDNKGISLIMMLYISPIALAAGILSTNKEIIPASFGSFVGLVFGFSVLGFLLHVVLQYQNWGGKIVKKFFAEELSKKGWHNHFLD